MEGTLAHAAYKGNVPQVQLLLAQDGAAARIVAKDADQRTPVHWAAAGGHVPVLTIFAERLSAGGGGGDGGGGGNGGSSDALEAVVNALDDQGWSPLMSAVSAGRVDAVEWLLARGAAPSVNALSKDNRVPLHYHKGDAALCALLLPLTKKEHVARSDRYGATALHRAASVGGEAVARLLLAHPNGAAGIDKKDSQGNTALHLAVIHKHERLARMLLEEGADPRARNNDGKTAIALGSDELVKDATAKYGGGAN